MSPTGTKQPVYPVALTPTPSSQAPTASRSYTLPAGWRKYRDKNGRSFYYNEESEESRWKPPRTSVSDDISEISDSEYAEQVCKKCFTVKMLRGRIIFDTFGIYFHMTSIFSVNALQKGHTKPD